MLEVMVTVFASHQCRAVGAPGDLAHIRRNIPDREADAPIACAADSRLRSQSVGLMQRHLAGGEFQHRRLPIIDLNLDLLAA